MVHNMMGANDDKMERLFYENTMILMSESKFMKNRPAILMADVQKPTNFGSDQRATRRIVLILYPPGFDAKFMACVENARGLRNDLEDNPHAYLTGYKGADLNATDDEDLSEHQTLFLPENIKVEALRRSNDDEEKKKGHIYKECNEFIKKVRTRNCP